VVLGHPTSAPCEPFFYGAEDDDEFTWDEERMMLVGARERGDGDVYWRYETYCEVMEIPRRDKDPRSYHMWLQELDALYKEPEGVPGGGDECAKSFTHLDIVAVLAMNAADSAYIGAYHERQMAVVLVLRDGRFCFVIEHSYEGTHSHRWDLGMGCNVARCITSPSLELLIHRGLDPLARHFLGLSHIDSQPMPVRVAAPAIRAHNYTSWGGYEADRLRFYDESNKTRLYYAVVSHMNGRPARILGSSLWGVRSEQEAAEPDFIVTLASDADKVVGSGLGGQELFRLESWAPMPCQSLKEKIGKSWNVQASQLRVVATDSDRQLCGSDEIDDVSSVIIKKRVEPASRTYARELHAKWKEFYPRGSQIPGGFPTYLRELPQVEADKTIQSAAGTGPAPRLCKQKSMMTERKEKAREDMEESTGAHLDTQEVTSLKQVLTWCKLQFPKSDNPVKALHEEPKQDIVHAADVPDGVVVLPHKDKDEFFVAPKAKHKSHKHHKSKKPVTHDAMSLKLFASLNLEIPSTPEDCDKIIHDVKVRLSAHNAEEDQRRKEEVEYWRRRLEGGHEDEECHDSRARGNVWTWGPPC
jgi:hypothetical protein